MQNKAKSKWLTRSKALPGGNLEHLRSNLRKNTKERIPLVIESKRMAKRLSVINGRIKVLYDNKKRLELAIGMKKGKHCPCLKTIIHEPRYRWNDETKEHLCLARKNTWRYHLKPEDFLMTYCGQCKMGADYRTKKAMVRQIEGEWKSVTEK